MRQYLTFLDFYPNSFQLLETWNNFGNMFHFFVRFCTVKLLEHWQTCLHAKAENCHLKLTSRQNFVGTLSIEKIKNYE